MRTPAEHPAHSEENDHILPASSTLSDISLGVQSNPSDQNTQKQYINHSSNTEGESSESSGLSDPPGSGIAMQSYCDDADLDMADPPTADADSEEEDVIDKRGDMEGALDEAGEALMNGIRRPYRRRRSTKWKIQRVIQVLKEECRWNLMEFLNAWVTCDAEFNCKRYGNPRRRTKSFRHAFEQPSLQRSSEIGSASPPINNIQGELRRLIEKPNFGTYDNAFAFEQYDIPHAIQTIRGIAPTWYGLMFDLLKNERSDNDSHVKSERQDNESIPKKLFMITAMVCHSRFRKRSNIFHASLSLYLQGSGTKRRCTEVLHSLGLCQSYNTTSRAMTVLAKQAKVCKSPRVR